MDREIQENKWLREHIAPGKQTGQYRVTGQYSYRSQFCADDGLLLVGDAIALLDLLIGNAEDVDFPELFEAIGNISGLPQELDYGFQTA